MFSHIMVGSNDIARSKKFYDALFAAMGAPPGTEDARGRLAYAHNGGR
ncbi:MAG TPA: VOC family protein, partial [Stellaceae bacterium]|nr:VOC family protein [Stellaceae bacterium]